MGTEEEEAGRVEKGEEERREEGETDVIGHNNT